MKPSYRLLTISLFAILVLATTATAQVDNWVELRCTPQTTYIQVDIEMDIGGTLPAEWTGWIVQRTTIGPCEETVELGPPGPFPVGAQNYRINNNTVEEGVVYRYSVRAVTTEGDRVYLGGPPAFPPGYYHDDFASLGNAGMAASGLLIDMGWTLGIEVCSNDCWLPLAFISDAPPDLAAGADTGVVVAIFGRIDNEFEGPYISQVTDWAVVHDCGTVPNEVTDWGGLKARYR